MLNDIKIISNAITCHVPWLYYDKIIKIIFIYVFNIKFFLIMI